VRKLCIENVEPANHRIYFSYEPEENRQERNEEKRKAKKMRYDKKKGETK